MWWRVVAQSPSGDSVEWLQYGVLGLVVVALLTGLLWAKPAVDRIIRENEHLRDEQAKQIEALIGEIHALREEVRDRERGAP